MWTATVHHLECCTQLTPHLIRAQCLKTRLCKKARYLILRKLNCGHSKNGLKTDSIACPTFISLWNQLERFCGLNHWKNCLKLIWDQQISETFLWYSWQFKVWMACYSPQMIQFRARYQQVVLNQRSLVWQKGVLSTELFPRLDSKEKECGL